MPTLIPDGRNLVVPWKRRRRRPTADELPDPTTHFINGDCIVLYTDRGKGKSVGTGSLAKQRSALYDLLGTGQDVIGNMVIGESHIVGERLDCWPNSWAQRLRPMPGESERDFNVRLKAVEDEAAAHVHNEECPTVPMASDDNRIIPFIRMGIFKPHRSLILIDEMTQLASSWSSMSRATKEVVQFLTQIRKFQCEILGATQFPRRLSGAVAEQIQWWGLVVPPPDHRPGEMPEYITIEWYEYHRGGPALPERSGDREPDGGQVEIDLTLTANWIDGHYDDDGQWVKGRWDSVIDTHAKIDDQGVRVGSPPKAYDALVESGEYAISKSGMLIRVPQEVRRARAGTAVGAVGAAVGAAAD